MHNAIVLATLAVLVPAELVELPPEPLAQIATDALGEPTTATETIALGDITPGGGALDPVAPATELVLHALWDPIVVVRDLLISPSASEEDPSPVSAAGVRDEPIVERETGTAASAWTFVPDPFHGTSAWTGAPPSAQDVLSQALAAAEEAAGPTPDPPGSPDPLPVSDSPLADAATLASAAIGATALVAILASLYSRFQKHNLLRSPKRSDLHARVLSEPGISLAELARATGLSRGSLTHHCRMLEKHGLLASRHDGLHRRFFPPGPAAPPTLRPPTSAESRILEVLEIRGPLSQRELARHLDVSPQAVHEQVRRLELHGRIETREVDGKRRWVTAGEGGH